MSLHPELAAFAERELGDILAAPPLTTQDALEFALVNGGHGGSRNGARPAGRGRAESGMMRGRGLGAGGPARDPLRW